MSKAKWPESVPVLTADDLCVKRFSDHKGRHCISGWIRYAKLRAAVEVEEELLTELRTDLPLVIYNDFGEVDDFNTRAGLRDNRSSPGDTRARLRKIAAAWNRVMRRHGYVVESKR